MPSISMTVNGKAVTVDVEQHTLLVEALREKLGLTGTHVGCDTSQCGACVVHVDGKSIKMPMIGGDHESMTMIHADHAENVDVHIVKEVVEVDGEHDGEHTVKIVKKVEVISE